MLPPDGHLRLSIENAFIRVIAQKLDPTLVRFERRRIPEPGYVEKYNALAHARLEGLRRDPHGNVPSDEWIIHVADQIAAKPEEKRAEAFRREIQQVLRPMQN